jgi:hypothetical protein
VKGSGGVVVVGACVMIINVHDITTTAPATTHIITTPTPPHLKFDSVGCSDVSLFTPKFKYRISAQLPSAGCMNVRKLLLSTSSCRANMEPKPAGSSVIRLSLALKGVD